MKQQFNDDSVRQKQKIKVNFQFESNYHFVIIKMEPEHQHQKQQLINELLEFGFDKSYVEKAVSLTLNKEKAAEIIMKLVEQGPEVDLSMYGQQKKAKEQKVQKFRPNRAKMLFVINGELKMGKGKICAQVGHGVVGAYLQIQEVAKYDQKNRERLHSWEMSGGAKIVVKAQSLQQMLTIKEKLNALENGINTYLVEDAGHTQIQAGSKTVLAIGPAFSNEIDPITEHLKLL